MKKVIICSIVALFTMTMSAQNAYRQGNKYYLDGQFMNKKAFAIQMQEKAESQLSMQFSKGLKVANAGWGLSGGGAAVGIIGCIVYSTREKGSAKDEYGNYYKKIDKGAETAGILLGCLGSVSFFSGIVCLGIGYKDMHNAADIYIDKRKNQPQAYFSIKANSAGIGLALNF